MIDEHRKEQASLYALGSLPEVEVGEFEKALHTDSDLKLLILDLESALDKMVFAFPRVGPPDELKQKILSQLDHRETPGSQLLRYPLGSMWRRIWLPGAFVVALMAFGLVNYYEKISLRGQIADRNQQLETFARQNEKLGQQWDSWRHQGDQQSSELQSQLAEFQKRMTQSAEEFQTDKSTLQSQFDQRLADLQKEKTALQDQLEEIADENQRLATALQTAQAELLAAQNRSPLEKIRVGMLSSALENAPKAVATSVWDTEHQRGLFQAENLAPVAADSDYQLWLIDPRYPNPISAGIFKPDLQGGARFQFRTDFRVDSVDKFAVTLERKGGAARPQGKTVLVSN